MQNRPLHKMLRSRKFSITLSAWVQAWILPLVILMMAGAAFSWNHESVFIAGQVYYIDGDCYSRMSRVRQIEHAPFTSIRVHTFENYPQGTHPHTTAPLDILIALFALLLRPFVSQPLAVAGALISPMLGILTLVALAIWANVLRLPFRTSMGLLLAISPITAHGFLLGRPDHQSLLLLLIALALAAEAAIWIGQPPKWRYLSATAWGMALWVSLFEPLIILAIVLVARGAKLLLLGRKATLPCETPVRKCGSLGPLAVFAGILAFAWAWDGWRAAAFDTHFDAWAKNIGELRHGTPEILFSWTGWLLAIAPFLLIWQFWKNRAPIYILWLILLIVTAGLSVQYLRWGYFLALTFGMSLPWMLSGIRWKWLARLAFAASLWPVAGEWDRMLYPDAATFRARVENREDATALRGAALSLRDLPVRGVVAPWWFCPAVVWWSGQPCLGGTSHQSLPGIADSSEIYLSTDISKAKEIMARRKAGYLIAYEPARIISNAAQILQAPVPDGTLAEQLYKNPRSYPDCFTLIHPALGHPNRFFRVYEFLRAEAEVAPSPAAIAP